MKTNRCILAMATLVAAVLAGCGGGGGGSNQPTADTGSAVTGSASAATLFLDLVSRCIARNQRVSANLVASKIEPLMTPHWWRQSLHWKYSRPSRRNELSAPEPYAGQAKPSGQREAISAASHLSSLPYCSKIRPSKAPAEIALGSSATRMREPVSNEPRELD